MQSEGLRHQAASWFTIIGVVRSRWSGYLCSQGLSNGAVRLFRLWQPNCHVQTHPTWSMSHFARNLTFSQSKINHARPTIKAHKL